MAQRSFENITRRDLKKLTRLAFNDLSEFLKTHPQWQTYHLRILCVALCQGAALHYLEQKVGVKDFDVWIFFRSASNLKPFPYRRVGHSDFGHSRFGKREADKGYLGRRVDIIGRSLVTQRRSPVLALQDYLREKKTKSARLLAKKAVIIIYPEDLLGTVAWPKES